MNAFRAWLAAGLLLAGGAAALNAQTLPAEQARKQEQVQRQVQAMARELVGSVLDLQLQQLKENGLTSHPWYGEIRNMQTHLDDMIKAEMPAVLALLTKTAKGTEAERQQAFQQARLKGREIVIRLLVERQSLLRRLKIAEMAAQVQQLILLQTEGSAGHRGPARTAHRTPRSHESYRHRRPTRRAGHLRPVQNRADRGQQVDGPLRRRGRRGPAKAGEAQGRRGAEIGRIASPGRRTGRRRPSARKR